MKRLSCWTFLLFFNLFLGLRCFLHAESLEEMADLAKHFDAHFLSARADEEASSCQVQEAFSQLLPTIDLDGDWMKNHILVTYDNRRFTKIDRDYDSAQWSAQLTQPIFDLKAWTGLGRAQTAHDLAGRRFRQAELDLFQRLTQAYYDTLFAIENVRILEEEKSNLASRLANIKGLHQSGVVAGTETLQVKSRLAMVEAQLLEAQWTLANKRRLLKSMTGPDVGDPDPVGRDQIENNPGYLEDWLARLPDNVQVQSKQLDLEIAKQGQGQAASGFWPSIEAIGTYGDAMEGPTASLPVETINKNYSAGFRCTWTLFSGFGTIAACNEVQKNADKAQAELKAAQREVSIQIAQYYSGISSGFKQLQALDQSVAAGKEVVQAMEEGYHVGAHSLMELLDARQQLLEAKRERSEAFYKLLMDQCQLHLAVGEINF